MILDRLSKLVNTFDINGGIFAISSIRLKQKICYGSTINLGRIFSIRKIKNKKKRRVATSKNMYVGVAGMSTVNPLNRHD